MAENLRLICAADELVEGGKGVRFTLERYGVPTPAFVIRYHGQVFAYFNECGHVPAQLDWQPGEFFDDSKLYLICSIHGALYAPDTGRCLGGRCGRTGLKPVRVSEIQGQIYVDSVNDSHG